MGGASRVPFVSLVNWFLFYGRKIPPISMQVDGVTCFPLRWIEPWLDCALSFRIPNLAFRGGKNYAVLRIIAYFLKGVAVGAEAELIHRVDLDPSLGAMPPSLFESRGVNQIPPRPYSYTFTTFDQRAWALVTE